jgi:response regulator RpfG family c-di-GMP phosphodiesterase
MKIALVDDSELDLMINKRIIELTYNDSQVVSFRDPDSFFSYLEQGDIPDIVISDMQMPKKTGLELAHEYIDKFGEEHSKLFLLTAFVDGTIEKKVSDVSTAIRLIEKPLSQSVLKAFLDLRSNPI